MRASQSAVKSRAEAIEVARAFDWLILFTAFFVILGGYHIHYMLTGGDWDFWTDWKDRRLWVTVAPIVSITFPAAVQAVLWGRYRIPWGATVCVLGLLLGEWINRYFNFWGWTYFPVNFVFPSNLIPGAILLDVILMWTGSYTMTAVAGGLGWGLIFYPGNWPIIAPMHIPVEYNGMMFTLADLQGYHYVRTGTPEYIRMVEKGTLRTFGKDVAPVSAFFSGFVCIIMYFLWHFFGEWFGSTKFVVPSPNPWDKSTNDKSKTGVSSKDTPGTSEPVDAHPKNPTGDPGDSEATPFRQILVTGHSPSGVTVDAFKPKTKYKLKFRVAAPSGGNLANGDVDIPNVLETGLDVHWKVVSKNVKFLAVSSDGAIEKLEDSWLAKFDLTIPGQGYSATVELDVCTTDVNGELTLVLTVDGEEYRKLTVSLDMDMGAHVMNDAVYNHPNHLNLRSPNKWTESPERIAMNVVGQVVTINTSSKSKVYPDDIWSVNTNDLTGPIKQVRKALKSFGEEEEAADHLNDLDFGDMENRLHWECGLRRISVSNHNEQNNIIQKFKSEFESKNEECAVLVVHVKNALDKWTIAGFNDEGFFKSVLIDDPASKLSVELKKKPANENTIVELIISMLGRTHQWKPYNWSHFPCKADAAHKTMLTTLASGRRLRDLADKGYTLFDTCFPENSELRKIIEELKPGSCLNFTWNKLGNGDNWLSDVPWALMYLKPIENSESVNCEYFLGLRFRIGSTSRSPKSQSCALGDPKEVNSLHFLYWGSGQNDYVGDQSRWQREEFGKWDRQHFVPDVGSTNPKQQVVDALASPQPVPAGILYLYCHCSVAGGSEPRLQFGESDTLPDILESAEISQQKLNTNPLVFANACSTVEADPHGTSELESRFFRRGSHAFLGTETEVPVILASRFAWLFFQFFLRKIDPSPMEAGEALAQARLFLWTQYRNPGGLFYCLINKYKLSLASDEELSKLPKK